MDLNSKQILINNQYIGCLTGLTQIISSPHNSTGIIATTTGTMSNEATARVLSSPNFVDNVSERSTPNSLSSFSSTPNRITTPHSHQLQQQYSPIVLSRSANSSASCNNPNQLHSQTNQQHHHQREHQNQSQIQHQHHHNHNHHQHHHHHHQQASSSSSTSASSIFFPPLPARLSQQLQNHQQHQIVASSVPIVNTASSTKIVDRSPRNADINMNAEHERNREIPFSLSCSTKINQQHHRQQPHPPPPPPPPLPQQHHHHRFSSATSQQSSNPSSKLNSPSILPEKSFPAFFTELNNNNSKSSSDLIKEQQNNKANNTQIQPTVRRSINLTTASNDDLNRWPHEQQSDETYHLYHEPTDMDDDEEQKQADDHVNQPRKQSTEQEQSQQNSPIQVTKGSLSTILTSTTQVTNIEQQHLTNRRFSGQESPLNVRGKDISADIYQCYVSLKANERSNVRSRSYHGQKNSLNNTNSNTFIRPKQNLSSNSFADLPKSPKAVDLASGLALTMQEHCINELIGTEMNYTHALNHILTHFAKPLEPLLRRDANQLIFGHMKYFYNIHTTFRVDLVKNAPNVGVCFLNFRDKFLRYGDYCASLSRAQAVLEDLVNKNETIANQLDKCHAEADEGKFKLADLLSLPMQRILKYHLLLAELIKSSNGIKNNSENKELSQQHHKDLERAYDAMVDLGKYINESKRDTELMQIIDDIEQSISGLNMPTNTKLTDYGRLHVDGIIRVKLPVIASSTGATSPNNSSHHHNHHHHHHDSFIRASDFKVKPSKRYAFVFDKVLLMCKVGGNKGYQYKEALVLSEFTLDPDPMIVQSDTISAKHLIREKTNYVFNLIKISDQTSYSFYAKDVDMKNTWIEAIQRAFDNIRPTGNFKSKDSTQHDFLMHTFERATSCDHCGKLFHGIHYQGYRCRTCFTSAHKACLSSIRPCGPALPPKHNNVNNNNSNCTLPQISLKESLKEQVSPALLSNNSEDGSAFFGGANELTLTAKTLHHHHHQNHSHHLQQHSQTLQPDRKSVEFGDNNYVNSMLKHYPWFCGRMDREQAQSLLEKKPDGTFLVRVSPKHNGSFVISLIYNSKVNHMRIYVSKDNQLYLSQNRYFKSVFELVSWYEKNSLVESFHMLDAHLAIPYKKLPNLII